MAISVLILTLNEATCLPGCLESVAWCDDVVVFDSLSTDDTISIAEAAGARVFKRKFDNYANQRNAALHEITYKYPWVLMLDADERMTPELRLEMLQAVASVDADVALFRMRFKNFLNGRWLKRSSGYPTWAGRLVRPGRVRIAREINEELAVDGRSAYLREHFLHYPFSKGLAFWIERHNRYSSMEARTLMAERRRRIEWRQFFSRDPASRRRAVKQLAYRLPGRPFGTFCYLYFLKRGFLDGAPGFTYARLRSMYETMIDLKTAEIRQTTHHDGKHQPLTVDFWSSVEYTANTRELAAALARRGITLRSRYQMTLADYWAARRGWARLWLRVRMYLLYPMQIGFDFLFRRRPGLAIVCSNTFYAPWLAMRLAGRRRRVVNLLYDIYPETLIQAGVLRAEGCVARGVARIVSDAMRRAAATVFLGERLRAQVVTRYGANGRSVIIPVGAVEEPFQGSEPQARAAGCPPVVLYCGNMGCMHEVETVATYLAATPEDTGPGRAQWHFHATGSGYQLLRRALAGLPATAPILLGGNLPEAQWRQTMLDADVALVTMRPGAETVLMPSKTYSALLAGQAILAVCPSASDLADLVREHQCGWVIEPGDSAGLTAALRTIEEQPERLLLARRRAREAGLAHYGFTVVAQQWAALFGELAKDGTVQPTKQPSNY